MANLSPAPQHLVNHATQQLAAIVESSHDAILTKDLNGIITSWNAGAQRLFGYTAEEAVGQPVTLLIPADREDEEPGILARIRRDERVDHYETIRQRKDGSLLHISLTVSPLKDENGTIIGASKIARDITAQKRAQEGRDLLLQEMRHRIKNLFSLADGLVSLCARSAETPGELVTMVHARLAALARAHELTVVPNSEEPDAQQEGATLHDLLRTILAPHLYGPDDEQLALSGEDLPIAASALTPVALVLNELATNAAKHGALSNPHGRLTVHSEREGAWVIFSWTEHSPQATCGVPDHTGFGSRLTQLTVEGQLEGAIIRDWKPEGLSVRITVPATRIIGRRDRSDPSSLVRWE